MRVHGLLLGSLLVASYPAHAIVTWSHSLRARLEGVEHTAFAHDAWAPTMRLRSGAAFGLGAHARALVELEGVIGIGNRYNSGANGATRYPSVVDPAGAEVNQVALDWRGDDWSARAGRQRLIFDSQRFIGNAGWRQNEQTFDAFDITGGTRLVWRYAYLDGVHRVAGDHARDTHAREHALAGHALHLRGESSWGAWSTYAFLVDNRTRPSDSSQTWGARWTSPAEPRLGLAAEFAQQADYRSSAMEFAHRYQWIEARARQGSTTWRVGWERLGGDGRHAVQTPLASLHAFNGWADVFTTTPAAGLDDHYASATGAWAQGRSTWSVAFHRFSPTRPGLHYGREWDVSLVRPLGDGWSVLGKVAVYRARAYASDTAKLWLQLEWAR